MTKAMDRNFWIGLIIGIIIVLLGLFIFGERTDAPSPTDSDIETLEDSGKEVDDSPQPGEAGGTIWNEFDGEIGI